MSQYLTRKKALNRKRDEMMDLFVDSRIKLANKPVTYGEFYDHVIDLDRPAPKVKSPSAQATTQPKPVTQSPVSKATPPTLEQEAKPMQPETKASDKKATLQTQTTDKKDSSSFWDSYTK